MSSVKFFVDLEGLEFLRAGAVRWEINVLNVAHKLADFMLHESSMMRREVT